MKIRVTTLLRAVLRTLGVRGPGSLLVSLDDQDRLVSVEGRQRWSQRELDELRADVHEEASG